MVERALLRFNALVDFTLKSSNTRNAKLVSRNIGAGGIRCRVLARGLGH